MFYLSAQNVHIYFADVQGETGLNHTDSVHIKFSKTLRSQHNIYNCDHFFQQLCDMPVPVAALSKA
jgi:hypothetical protein